MAVAITCGYGGYLLPLLAAHSSFIIVSLKFDHRGPIDKNPALVQIMAWCQTANKPLSDPMMFWFIDVYMHHLAYLYAHA